MDFIIDAIVEWLKGLLVDGIMGNLDGLFDNVNQSVGEIATQVGTTPADWNAGVFSMIRQISETAILPIAGVILTFVMTYELIQTIFIVLSMILCIILLNSAIAIGNSVDVKKYVSSVTSFDFVVASPNTFSNKLRVKISTPSEGTEKSGFYN